MTRLIASRFEGALSGVLLAVALVVVFGEFIGREVADYSFSWSDEVARYLLVWVTYIGAAAVTKDSGHIRVEFFTDLLPPRGRYAAELLANVLSLVFTSSVFVFGFHYVYDSWKLGLMTAESTLFVPKWIVLAVIPIGFLLMSIRLVIQIVEVARRGPDGLRKVAVE